MIRRASKLRIAGIVAVVIAVLTSVLQIRVRHTIVGVREPEVDLASAVGDGNVGTIQSALKANPRSVVVNRYNGQSLLEIAINDSQLRIARLLLENGADANGKDTYLGEPLIIMPIKGRDFQMVKLLAEHGADLTFEIDRQTLDKFAETGGSHEIAEYLRAMRSQQERGRKKGDFPTSLSASELP